MQPDPSAYLEPCDVIDFQDDAVARSAARFATGNVVETARQCFQFVRDEIQHSGDFQREPITCKASEVFAHKTGFCYAKSHLLCAILRANGIPAGLCYQRLSLDGAGPPFCLHGLNAAYLPDVGWYRFDARGNRDPINAGFDPPREQLAFVCTLAGEHDVPGVHVAPLASVVRALQTYGSLRQLEENLPDMMGS